MVIGFVTSESRSEIVPNEEKQGLGSQYIHGIVHGVQTPYSFAQVQ